MSEKKKMGRPRQHEEAKREPIAFRVTPTMKAQIAAAAEATGRSIAQEIEWRLERSFMEDRLLGGEDISLLTKLIAVSIRIIELETGHDWRDDRMAWEAVSAAVRRILSRYQPQIDVDIWDRHRDLMLSFMEPVWHLDRLKNELEGLAKAYPTADDMPPEIAARYNSVRQRYEDDLAAARSRAREIFEGPMREQSERTREAIKLGRKVAGVDPKYHGSFIVGGIARMFKKSGAFEPLPGLRDPSTVTDEELFDCIRRLAGAPPEDPDMEVFRMKRTYEDFENERASGPTLKGKDESGGA